jgi:molybdenum cofactor cytidylyltransferase
MVAAEDCALVLLAAGLSRRFGGDKLSADLAGRPLGLHGAATLASLPLAERIAVIGGGGPDYAALGFRIVRNPDPGAGQAGSLRLGVRAARESGAAAVLIALADMPFVTSDHVRRLLAAGGEDVVVASSDGARRSPPALFGRGWFDRLEQVSGDQGARALLREAAVVAADPRELVDVDTPAALDELTARPAAAKPPFNCLPSSRSGPARRS